MVATDFLGFAEVFSDKNANVDNAVAKTRKRVGSRRLNRRTSGNSSESS